MLFYELCKKCKKNCKKGKKKARPGGVRSIKKSAPDGALIISSQARAFLAVSVSWVKAALSLTAISASILRLMMMPAFFRPFIKVE